MTWARIDVDFFDHPKLAGLSELEQFAYVKVILWCQKHDTDGVIELDVPFRTFTKHTPDRTRERLISRRLIVLDDDGNLTVPNFISRQGVEHQRKKRAGDAERQRRHRENLSQNAIPVTRDVRVTSRASATVRNETVRTPPPNVTGNSARELERLRAADFGLPNRDAHE